VSLIRADHKRTRLCLRVELADEKSLRSQKPPRCAQQMSVTKEKYRHSECYKKFCMQAWNVLTNSNPTQKARPDLQLWISKEGPIHQFTIMGVGRWAPGFWKFQQKKVLFLVLSGKIEFHHFWFPLEKSRSAPPLKKIFPTPMFTIHMSKNEKTRVQNSPKRKHFSAQSRTVSYQYFRNTELEWKVSSAKKRQHCLLEMHRKQWHRT